MFHIDILICRKKETKQAKNRKNTQKDVVKFRKAKKDADGVQYHYSPPVVSL
jgi:hypothetical protein